MNLQWYLLSIKEQRYVAIMLQAAQHPVRLRAGAAVLNMELTFVNVGFYVFNVQTIN